jgi:hypothetical protein
MIDCIYGIGEKQRKLKGKGKGKRKAFPLRAMKAYRRSKM